MSFRIAAGALELLLPLRPEHCIVGPIDAMLGSCTATIVTCHNMRIRASMTWQLR